MDLRTDGTYARKSVRGSFDSLRSLRMTCFFGSEKMPPQGMAIVCSLQKKRSDTRRYPCSSDPAWLDFRPHPYRMRPKIKGLSHGLKNSPPDCFSPRLRRGRPFESRPTYKKNRHPEWDNGFSGTLEGTRTPDLLIRSQSLYPTELPAHFLPLSRALRYSIMGI